MVDSVLSETHVHFHSVCDPSKQGWPIVRSRLWGVLIRRSFLVEEGIGATQRLTMPGSLASFQGLFLRRCHAMLTYHQFLVATEEEITRESEWMKGRPSAEAPTFLNRSERSHLAKYREMFQNGKISGGDNAFNDSAFQVNQNPDFRVMRGKDGTLHTLIKNVGVIWCRGRSIVPAEFALPLGS